MITKTFFIEYFVIRQVETSLFFPQRFGYFFNPLLCPPSLNEIKMTFRFKLFIKNNLFTMQLMACCLILHIRTDIREF